MRKLHIGSSLAVLLMAGTLGTAYGADYTPVTDARLANPEPQNWLMTRGNYQGWSYSPLDQINTSNVKNLVPVWSVSTGVNSGHEAPPIVNNGMMFVSTPYSQVMALDAATGELLWRYKRKLPEGFSALHNTSRGVALYGDKVFLPALDAVLVALDAKTGKVAWEAKVADWKNGYYMTMAPLVVKGKVLVGVAGGEFGVRGFVEAFDAETGKSVWKTYTVPAPGEPGSETWEKPDTWKTGGASTWMTGNYDPVTNTVYWGTGNALALVRRSAARRQPLHVLDGRAGWRHRQDQGALPVPAEQVVGLGRDERADAGGFPEGRQPPRKGLLTPQRNGYLYWLGRNADGSISYLNSEAYVPQDVFKSIDPKTGRPDVDLDHKPGTGKAAQFCPGLWGGKDWPYEAYNPKTGMRLHSVQRKPLQQSRRQGRAAHSRPVVDRRRDPRLPLLGRYEGGVLRRAAGL